MKQLCSSSNLRELSELLKRLLHIGIPCAVCKGSGDSLLSVWIQQDADFPVALKMFVERAAPRPVPPWAHLLDQPSSAAQEPNGPSAVVMRTRERTPTVSAEGIRKAGGPELSRPLAVNQREAARLLGVSKSTIRKLVIQGSLTPVKVGGSLRYSIAQLEKLVSATASMTPP